jgi:hypothetical protein
MTLAQGMARLMIAQGVCTLETRGHYLTLEIAMKFVYCWLFVSLSPALWLEAATLRSAPMVGVWAATEAQFRATLDLQSAQNGVQPVQLRDGQAPSVQGVLLTIHPADRPVPTSRIAPEQWFAVVDVGLDACEITYYEATARSASGQQLRLRLTDRRSVVRLDCLTNITKDRPPWSVAIYEVDESAAVQDISVQMPLAYLDGAPDGDDEVQAWRDQQFDDAWVGLISEPRNPITAQTHYAFTGVDHPGPYVLDFDNARAALQSCGTRFMEAVLEPAGVAPLADQGSVRNVAYWRIAQCRRRG